MASDNDRLQLIVRLLDRIQSSMSGIDESAFLADQDLGDLIAHRMMHVAENASKLTAALKDRHPHMSWKKMLGMRNVIAHDYDGTNYIVLWMTMANSLGDLRAMCEAELANEKDEGE